MSGSADVDKLNSNSLKPHKDVEISNENTHDLEIKFSCYKCGLQEVCHYFGRKPPFVAKQIEFSCYKCGLQEVCHYFGRKPPFVAKQIEFTEDTYVMRDPFSPREVGRANFLQIGGHCNNCKRTVCVECSTFYYKRFCNECCAQYLSEFPPEIGTKIQKKLATQ